MDRFKVEFREPNVDRFLEVYLTLCFSGVFYDAVIYGGNERHNILFTKMVQEINNMIDTDKNSASKINMPPLRVLPRSGQPIKTVFLVEMPEHPILRINHITCKPYEDPRDIILRICTALGKSVDANKLPDAGISLLKISYERLGLNSIQTQAVLDLTICIAKLDGSEFVKPEHIAEAIMYVSNMVDTTNDLLHISIIEWFENKNHSYKELRRIIDEYRRD